MRYAHILLAVASEIWAIDEFKLDQIVSFLALQASGEKLSAEELRARVARQSERDVERRQGAVAILPLRGVIANRMNMMSDISGGTSSEAFGRMFSAAVNDPKVSAIVLDVDSPGGAVSGTDELSSLIFAARGTKPIVAHVNAQAASAAYWIATAADEMVLTPSAEVGSIGVLGVHNDISAALEKAGIKRTMMTAGRYKAEMAPSEPLSQDAMAYQQQRIDAHYQSFVGAVARNRGVDAAAVREGFGEGRMVSAADAVAIGMADRIATLDEVLAGLGAVDQAPATAKRAFAPQRAKRALALD
ncbi:S49 family peptidase [Georhizobium profundi]|uniref:S49 family peptidase n=1 Tax=Georhizobium profundi TaxID=2341112 RepID=A0A3Q8XP90_9HYPH|nr:S49 family peptidase [Georhizobium profundi]AZN72001.1 S49 family peptidase [Georhizobium profundi]